MSSPRRKYPAWQRRHYGVLKWLLDHPGATLRECARATGYCEWSLSRITNSPEVRQPFEAIMDAQIRAIYRQYLLVPRDNW
jgi:hypothetical protein